MKLDKRVRDAITNILENAEVYFINKAKTIHENYVLLPRYMDKSSKLDSKYKKEILEYWSKYKKINPRWHNYYSSKNRIFDPRYIPNDMYYTIIDQHFNNRKLGWGFGDKNYYTLILRDISQPKTLIRKINGLICDEDYTIIKKNDALQILSEYEEVICKPSIETGSGKGILFYSVKNDIEQIENILSDKLNKNFVIQKVIKQHDKLSQIHPNSVNTIRVVSLIIKDEIKILSSCLRMGVDSSRIDNVTAGGISCGIKEDGKLRKIAFSYFEGYRYENHPQGFRFEDFEVPSYQKAIALVKKAHPMLGHFRLISWDIAICENGDPVLIEANTRQGGINLHQFCNGPLFGDLTDEVLNEVFR